MPLALPSRSLRTLAPEGQSSRCSRVASCRRHARRSFSCRASEKDWGFDDETYYQATVHRVGRTPQGPVVVLKLADCQGLVLPIFVGEAEAAALEQEIKHYAKPRPGTHDLMKNSLALLGHKVVMMRISALVNNVFTARLHIAQEDGEGTPYDLDARPSDAMNLAIRFQAPLLVAKTVAHTMAVPLSGTEALAPASDSDDGPVATESEKKIEETCREECALYRDVNIMKNLELGFAVEQQRFEDASRLRDEIESEMQQDLSLKLVIAIQTALADSRYEEAARLRDELRSRRLQGDHKKEAA